jgi:N-methylhydantoinase A
VTTDRVARAMIDIADAAVARALRRVSVERGVDPRGCVLVPFGGGGPLHCCGLAEQLGMRRVYVPPHAGVLSALGLAVAAERRERIISVLSLTSDLDGASMASALERAAEGVMTGAGWDRRWAARARYVGQGHELDVPVMPGEDGTALAARFTTSHARRNGFTLDAPIEVIGLRYVTSGAPHPVRFERRGPSRWIEAFRVDEGGVLDASLTGPAVVVLGGATLRIAPGWRGTAHAAGGWILEQEASS